jgi:hypothetical protein
MQLIRLLRTDNRSGRAVAPSFCLWIQIAIIEKLQRPTPLASHLYAGQSKSVITRSDKSALFPLDLHNLLIDLKLRLGEFLHELLSDCEDL